MQLPPEQPAQAKSTGKKPQKPSSQQPPTEQTTQSTSKGKQPMQLPPERPAQAKSTSKKPQQLPPEQSKQAKAKVTQPHPKEAMQADSKGKQPQQPPAQQSEQGDSKDSPPTRKPVHGMPRLWITRIPVRRDAQIERVEVVVIPDTAYRHPQTFFFKNIPEVDRYWGLLNDAAVTAQRMVRLERDGLPTPYFLLACRGEYPLVKSPRNENAIFANMQVSVFGDAFVFKLASPELNEDGYTRYDHIDDIGDFDWIPQAIQEAARKVEYATASKANPGFPDITNYADQETISKDVHKMLKFVAAYRKAAKRKLPDIDTIGRWTKRFTTLLRDWNKDVFIATDVDPNGVIRKRQATFDEVAQNVNRIVSASTTTESSNTKTGDGLERVDHPIKAMNDAYSEWLTKHRAYEKEKARQDEDWGPGGETLEYAIDRKEANHAMLDYVMLKFDIYDALETFKVEVYKFDKYLRRVDAAGKSDAAGIPEANHEMSDLSRQSGTKRHREDSRIE